MAACEMFEWFVTRRSVCPTKCPAGRAHLIVRDAQSSSKRPHITINLRLPGPGHLLPSAITFIFACRRRFHKHAAHDSHLNCANWRPLYTHVACVGVCLCVSRNTHFRFNWATAQQFYCPTRAHHHRRWTPLNLLLALSQLHNLHLNSAAGFLVLQ
jgi:hypothetical protein